MFLKKKCYCYEDNVRQSLNKNTFVDTFLQHQDLEKILEVVCLVSRSNTDKNSLFMATTPIFSKIYWYIFYKEIYCSNFTTFWAGKFKK